MRVLLVSRWFWEEHRRMSGGFLRELADAVVAAGIDLTILSQSNDAGLAPEVRKLDGHKVWMVSREKRKASCFFGDRIVKIWSGYRKAVTDASHIRQMVREHGNFDAIWAQTEEPDGLACAIASFGWRCPPIVTQVQSLRYDIGHKGVRMQRQSSLGWVFRRSTLVLANSDVTASRLHMHYRVPPDRIARCRVHLTRGYLDTASQARATTPEQRILFLGAINRNKAPDIFLKATLRIAHELPGWRFVLVGGETDQDKSLGCELKALAGSPDLEGRVDWLGRISAEEVRQEILRSSMVVCPSMFETFSRATAEGLALGRPVIATETSGVATWVKDTGAGRVIPPGNIQALADAMLEVAQEQQAESKLAAASKAIVEALTPEKAAQDLVAAIQRSLSEPTCTTQK
jgi:glycosyltransferase involved in cell wall biosynthesis